MSKEYINNIIWKNIMNKFYVYQYLREDGSPYYIGKGTGNRAWTKGKNEIGKPQTLDRIVIIEDGLTDKEAIDLEIQLIQQYGRIDLGTGMLRNKTEGGEGAAGYKHTDLAKQKISDSSATRGPVTEQTKQKIIRHHKGKSRSEETKQKMREAWKNRAPMSEETKQKIAITQTGRKRSKEFIQKQQNRVPSDYARQVASKTHKNKVVSEETKQKMREAWKRRKNNE